MVARGLDPVGTGRQIELAARAFRAAGWDVTLAVGTAGGAVPMRLAAQGFAVHRLGTRPGFDVAAAARLAALCRIIGRPHGRLFAIVGRQKIDELARQQQRLDVVAEGEVRDA